MGSKSTDTPVAATNESKENPLKEYLKKDVRTIVSERVKKLIGLPENGVRGKGDNVDEGNGYDHIKEPKESG